MVSPTLSVIVPTCHRNDALALCLECLAPLVQNLVSTAYEVIVSDDGSQETAEKMIRERYPWVKWVAGPRRGPAANRNNGASQANGNYIAFTDDDCKPDSNWLQAYAEAAISGGEVYEGKTICSVPFQGPLAIAPVNLTGGMLWSCNLMVRKDVFEAIGGFDEGFPHAADEDTDLRKRLYDAGFKSQFVPSAIVDHPPVRRPWGRRSARLWESKVRLHYKYSAKNFPLRRAKLVSDAFKTRVRQVVQSPFSKDTLVAVAGLPLELWGIFRHFHLWKSKHRRASATLSRYSEGNHL